MNSRWLRGAPLVLFLLCGLAILVASAILFARGAGEAEVLPARPAEQRPRLAFVSSLPLIFPEGFSLDAGGSAALDALEQRYEVVPIGVASAEALAGSPMLMMAQPLAQPAEVLVELDAWVRAGGRALILADPALEWPSELPLGDMRRPAPFFADTGLLEHWGLELSGPRQRGPEVRDVDDRQVQLMSAGSLSAPDCEVAGEGLVARCAIGKGKATVIADADLLQGEGAEGAAESNLQFVLSELALLER